MGKREAGMTSALRTRITRAWFVVVEGPSAHRCNYVCTGTGYRKNSKCGYAVQTKPVVVLSLSYSRYIKVYRELLYLETSSVYRAHFVYPVAW